MDLFSLKYQRMAKKGKKNRYRTLMKAEEASVEGAVLLSQKGLVPVRFKVAAGRAGRVCKSEGKRGDIGAGKGGLAQVRK